MKAELQFFALPEDVEALLENVRDKVDSVDELDSQQGVMKLVIGECEIHLKASKVQEDMLLVGSVSINTGPVDDPCKDQERAKSVYRSLRKWVKKHYSNRLYSYYLEGDKREAAARNHWASPAALDWKSRVSERVFKLYDTSPIAFEIMVMEKGIGDVKPVAKKGMRGHG